MKKSLLLSRCLVALAYCVLPAISLAQWTPVATGVSKMVADIQFADSGTIYAVGDSMFIKSTDGGQHWTNLYANIKSVTSAYFSGLHFLDKDTGFIYRFSITGDATILKTTNGGQSWFNVSSPNMTQGVNDMFFINTNTGYAVGGFGAGNTFCKTTDGGLNWVKMTEPSINASPSVFFLNDSIGFSGDGGVQKTTNGGADWQATEGFHSGESVVDYHFFSFGSGIAITDSWHTLKTTDTGNTWALLITPFATSALCTGMAFVQNRYACAVGLANDKPLISNDSGNNWRIDNTFPAGYRPACVAAGGNKIAIGTFNGHVVLREAPVSIPAINTRQLDVLFYPNPSNGTFNLSSEHQPVRSVRIYDVHGQSIYEYTPIKPESNIRINIPPAAAKGLYYAEVDYGNGMQVQKLVVE